MEDRSRHSDASAPPHQRRKIQSHSQQLTDRGKPKIPRKHSLEEEKLLHLTHQFGPTTTTTTRGQEYKTRFTDDDDEQDHSSLNSSPNSLSSQHYNRNSQPRRPLPEFVAGGGGQGIFETPVRAAVPPGRPPSLELRPRPPRETQLGSFLRVILSSQTQLWAGHESGLRFWNFHSIYMEGSGKAGRRGDENTAPFHESVSMSPVTCMAMDVTGTRIIWSGHKDGAIRLWKMDQCFENENPFQESLVWRAHKGPVLSLALSSYGDLWSGCEGGMVKVWPWETMEKSLSLKADEKHMAPILVERSYIDLRTQVTVNGVCPLSHADVHLLLSDNSRAKVWSAGNQSFALWDARSKELIKVFNIDGQINHVDISTARDPCTEDETKSKLGSTSKKEKSGSSLSFLQRSRNALMGAADAVRRVAVKGSLGDDNYRAEALVFTADGMIWLGCSNGLLVQWDSNGNRLRDFNHHPFAVRCLCTFGLRIWVGYVTGHVQVLNLDGNLLGEWIAHNSPVIKMAVGVGYVFTLANHGGIRGWKITSPGPLDEILRSEVASKESLYTKLEKLKLLTGTWNVGQGKASHDSLILWLGSAASDVGIVVVGLQEVEMGAGFLAMSAAKETVGLEGSSTGQWWLETIGKHLDEGVTFERIGSRQLAGLLIAIWARKNLRSHIGDVDAAAVPCGLGRAIGNKGAVGLRIRVYDRIMCFVNCHLAAHLEAVNRRNADFDHVYRTMTFNRLNLVSGSTAANSPAMDMHNPTNPEDRKPELAEADMVVFLGDLNYRLHGISYEQAKDFVSQRCFDWLREKDQLRAEMKAAKVFQGMREGLVTFPPTYKFQRHQPGLGGYDSSEKKRIPAWCDRVLYRDNRSCSVTDCSLECPVVSSALQYEACMEVTDSDHKPVRCIFSVDICCIDESARRQEFGRIIDNEKIKLHANLWDVPETTVSTNDIVIQNKDQYVLEISNTCKKEAAIFEIICEGQSIVKENGQVYDLGGSFGFPRWLQVIPATGLIKPGKIAEVLVNREEFHTQQEFVDGLSQSRWCEDTRDKVVILLLKVRSTCSVAVKTHRVNVSHSSAYKSIQTDSSSDDSRRIQSELQQPQLQHSSCSSDIADSKHNSPTQSIDDRFKVGSRRTHARGIQSKDLQQPELQHLNSSFDVGDSKDSFHVQSTEEKTKKGSYGDNANLWQPNSQHLNSSSNVVDSKHSFHAQTADQRTKTESERDDPKGVHSKSLQQSDVQHPNSSSDGTESKHGVQSNEMSRKGSREDNAKGALSKNLQRPDLQQLNSSSDVVDPQHSLYTQSTEERNKKGSTGDNVKEIHSKNLQQTDMQRSNNSSDVVDSKRSFHTKSTEERRKNGSRRDRSEGINSSSDAAVSEHSFQTQPTVEKTKSGFQKHKATEIQWKNLQRSDMQNSSSLADVVVSKHGSQSSEEGTKKESPVNIAGKIQTRNFQQTDSQHLSNSSDVTNSIHNFQSTEERTKKGPGGSNAMGTQPQNLPQPDLRQLSSSSDLAISKHNTQSTEARASKGSGENNSLGIQPKNLKQPDLQPLNSSDIADSQHGSQSREENGPRGSNATGYQPKNLQKPDLQHNSNSSDADDSKHSTQSTDARTAKGYIGNDSAGIQPKNLQQTDSQNLNSSSDVANSKHSSKSTEKSNEKGFGGNDATGTQRKNIRKPDSQHFNSSSDVADSRHSFQSTEGRIKERPVGNDAAGNQPKNLQQPDLRHCGNSSDVADSKHITQSTEVRTTKGSRGNDSAGNQPKNLQQTDSQYFDCSSDVANSKHRSQSTGVRTTKGSRGNDSTCIQQRNLQQPDSQHGNSSFDAAETKHSSQSTEERAKKGIGGNNDTGNQPKNIQKSDSRCLNVSSDVADSGHGIHSTEGKTKKGPGGSNASGNQQKNLQQPDLGQFNNSSDVADSKHSIQSMEARITKGYGGDNSTGVQPKSFQQPDLQHLNTSDVAFSKRNSQSTEDIIKKGSGGNNSTGIQPKSIQKADSRGHHVAESKNSSQSTEERTKKESEANDATRIQLKSCQQPDSQHFNRSFDISDSKHSSQSTEKSTKKELRVNNVTELQPKNFQGPDLQHLISSSDASDCSHSSQSTRERAEKGSRHDIQNACSSSDVADSRHCPQSTEEMTMKGSQCNNASKIQSKSLQQPDLKHLNNSSFAADNQYGMCTPSIHDNSKNENRKSNTEAIQSKSLRQPDQQQISCTSDVAKTQQSYHGTPSIDDKCTSGSQKDNDGGNRRKTPQDPLSLHLTSNATDIQHSSDTLLTKENSPNKAQGNNGRGTQSMSMKQTNLQDVNHAVDTKHNLHTLMSEEQSRDGAHKCNVGEFQSKTFQQPNPCGLNSSTPAVANQHNLCIPMTGDNIKHGAQKDNITGIQSKTLQQPDLRHVNSSTDAGTQSKVPHHVNCSSNATDTQYKSHAPPIEENGQTGAHRVIAGEAQLKSLQRPESQHRSSFADEVLCHQNSHIPSIEEKGKNGSQRKNSRGVESENYQEAVSQHSNCLSSASQHSLRTLPIEERSKNEDQRNTCAGVQSKTIQQTNLQHPNNYSNAASNKHNLQTPSVEDRSKTEAQRDNRGDPYKTSQQTDLQHPKIISNATDNHGSLRAPSTEENSINEGRRKNVGSKKSKTVRQQIKFL